MTEGEMNSFWDGYNEARHLAIDWMKKITSLKKGHLRELKLLVRELEEEERQDHWRAIQKEFPGITEEQYLAELDSSMEQIRERYYRKKSPVELVLIRSPEEK
jgi:hypothetical protein